MATSVESTSSLHTEKRDHIVSGAEAVVWANRGLRGMGKGTTVRFGIDSEPSLALSNEQPIY